MADLLHQWTEMLDRFYTVPYVVLTSRKEWQAHSAPDHPNAFIQDAIVVTTYDFAADNEEAAKVVNWDLTVFEEANALSPVYQEDNKQAKALKRIAGDSFKLLLTGTPIEKNIMDLYGLIWFIDEKRCCREKKSFWPGICADQRTTRNSANRSAAIVSVPSVPRQALRQGDGTCAADRGVHPRQGRAAAL